MGWLLSRSVEIQISNNTQNITLRNPRTYFDCGRCSRPPSPSVPPGSTESSFFPGDFPFRGVAGVLVYEAGSFSLAIHFCNPIDYIRFSMEVGLELSPGNGHRDLEATYTRMAGGMSSPCLGTQHDYAVLSRSHGTARVSAGPLRVMASMSNATDAVLEVLLEEEGESEEKAKTETAGTETPSPGIHYQEN